MKNSHLLKYLGRAVKIITRHTLREEIFAVINFREFFFGHFAGIDFCEFGFTEDFVGING